MSDARWTRRFWLLISVWNQAILLWLTQALQSWASAVTVIKYKNCTKINVDQERFPGLQGRATAQNVKNEVKIQLTLEQRGDWGADPSHSQKSTYNFIISPSYPHGSTFAVSINSGPTVLLLFTPEKTPHVSGLTQFKPALPKDLSVCHLFQQITNPSEHKSLCCAQSCLTLCNPMNCMQPARLLCPWEFPSKNTGVACYFLLQGTFLTQGSNPHLLHWQADSLS